MLDSLISNKATIRRMSRDDLEEHKSIHGADLSNEEWKVLEVDTGFANAYFLIFSHPPFSHTELAPSFGFHAGFLDSFQTTSWNLKVYGGRSICLVFFLLSWFGCS